MLPAGAKARDTHSRKAFGDTECRRGSERWCPGEDLHGEALSAKETPAPRKATSPDPAETTVSRALASDRSPRNFSVSRDAAATYPGQVVT